jgi:hypothetical protein
MSEFFPILRHPEFRLPWVLIAPHARQAQRNHSQTLERLAERGGLSFDEAAAILEDRPWSAIQFPGQEPSAEAARRYLERLIAARS